MAEQSVARTIDEITKRIINYDDCAQNRVEDALRLRVDIGKLLMQAKELLPHGEFMAWARKSFKWEKSHVQRHMELARKFPRVGNLPPDTSLRMALKAIAAPKEPVERPKTEKPRVVLVLSTGEEAVLEVKDGPADVVLSDLAGMQYRELKTIPT